MRTLPGVVGAQEERALQFAEPLPLGFRRSGSYRRMSLTAMVFR